MIPEPVRVTHSFVELMPKQLEFGVVYVSVEYKTIAHLCCCGCGNKVVTPLSPTGWQLAFDGRTISIFPSIGNWNLECQSHYWIEKGKVYWARKWPKWKIEAGFARDQRIKREYFGEFNDEDVTSADKAGEASAATRPAGESAAASVRPKKKRRKWWW